MVPPLALRIADAASAPRFGQIEETQGEAVASRLPGLFAVSSASAISGTFRAKPAFLRRL